MTYKFLFLQIILILLFRISFSQNALQQKIIIEAEVPDVYYKAIPDNTPGKFDHIELSAAPFDYIPVYPEWQSVSEKIMNNKIKWTVYIDKPVLVTIREAGIAWYYTTPGDSIHIAFNRENPVFSGKSADVFNMQYELQKIRFLKGPTKHPLVIRSLDNYFKWLDHIEKQLQLIHQVLEKYKSSVTTRLYEYMKETMMAETEGSRCAAFTGLYDFFVRTGKVETALDDLNKIWDATQTNTTWGNWYRSNPDYYGGAYYLYDFNRQEVRRQFNFDFSQDTLESKQLRVKAYYDHAKKKYNGLTRERLLSYIITEEIITEVGPAEHFTQAILKDYYNLPGFPEYKQWVKKQVRKEMARREIKEKKATAIENKQVEENDGPYILYKDEMITAYRITNKTLITEKNKKTKSAVFQVRSDMPGKNFVISIKQSATPEPSEYAMPEKLMALSDIEGNFQAFRQLLRANKIIDKNFNWIFGKGHLVFAGDMFDRGDQVTECLWLVYMLEEKAKTAGGYVHFVLGNHEIMNLQGNHYYTRQKYKDNAALIGKTLVQLYNENSELGRWLRTKNIMEKIGGLLFVHGGISPEVNRLPLTLPEMNILARPYYGGNIDSSNDALLTLFDSRYGERYRISPLWSRAYYKNTVREVITNKQLDSTLKKFGVNHIITGHTIVADTISTWYNGTIINLDTKHKEGKSEALLIEGDKFYRVNTGGERVLLLAEDRRNAIIAKP